MNQVSIIDIVIYAVIACVNVSTIVLSDVLLNLLSIYSNYLKDIRSDQYSNNLHSSIFTCSYDYLLLY